VFVHVVVIHLQLCKPLGAGTTGAYHPRYIKRLRYYTFSHVAKSTTNSERRI